MDDELFTKAQWYILNNCTELDEYLKAFLKYVNVSIMISPAYMQKDSIYFSSCVSNALLLYCTQRMNLLLTLIQGMKQGFSCGLKIT